MTKADRQIVLIALLLCDLVCFGIICWAYPYVWKPKPEGTATAVIQTDKYNLHYMVLDSGECIPVYKLKKEFKE